MPFFKYFTGSPIQHLSLCGIVQDKHLCTDETHKICQLNTSWKYKSRDLKFKLHLFIQIIFLIFKEISSLIKIIFSVSSIKCENELKQDMDTE